MTVHMSILKNIHPFIILILLLTNRSTLSAQEDLLCPSDNGKAQKMYEKAVELLNTGTKEERTEAYSLLIDAVKLDENFAEAIYTLADINFEKAKLANDAQRKLQLENRAYSYYEKVILTCPQTHDYESYFILSQFEYKRNQYQKALDFAKKYQKVSADKLFKKDNEALIERLETYFELMAHPVEFNPVKVEGICTPQDEFLPIISPDGELAIYTRRQVIKDPGNQSETLRELLTVSTRQNAVDALKEVFNTGQSMSAPFNQTGKDQGAMSMTINNKELYITICQQVKGSSGSFVNCDIYVSYYRDGTWSELYNLGPNINGKYSWESQPSISADGKNLYFASIRPENLGFDINNNQTSDIYVSTKDATGQWSPAKNLGKSINTTGNEKSPFLHTDSRTLYFSSDGWPGVGGYDIFYAKETENAWLKPVNIGYPINKTSNDLGFFVSTNGKRAYFSSDEMEQPKQWNVYSFDLYEKARPEKVLFTKGKLIDEEGNVLVDAKVEVKSSLNNKTVEGMVDKETGEYAVAVAIKKDEEVLMTVKKEGYAFSSKYIKADDVKATEAPVKVNMEVKKVETGKTVQIEDINFATNSAMFLKGSMFVLDNFVKYLQDNPNIKIEIHGHTDNVGNAKNNKKLSEDRAKTVRDYLVFQGVAPERIVNAKGFGSSKPIADNNTESGRSQNRRTEFVIVGM